MESAHLHIIRTSNQLDDLHTLSFPFTDTLRKHKLCEQHQCQYPREMMEEYNWIIRRNPFGFITGIRSLFGL